MPTACLGIWSTQGPYTQWSQTWQPRATVSGNVRVDTISESMFAPIAVVSAFFLLSLSLSLSRLLLLLPLPQFSALFVQRLLFTLALVPLALCIAFHGWVGGQFQNWNNQSNYKYQRRVPRSKKNDAKVKTISVMNWWPSSNAGLQSNFKIGAGFTINMLVLFITRGVLCSFPVLRISNLSMVSPWQHLEHWNNLSSIHRTTCSWHFLCKESAPAWM